MTPGSISEPDVLFDLPADYTPPPEQLTRAQRRRRLVETRISNGEHPLGRPVLLHPDASRDPSGQNAGLKCGQCKFRVLLRHHDRTYPKCWFPSLEGHPHPRSTHCESSDIRSWWPACRNFAPKEEQ